MTDERWRTLMCGLDALSKDEIEEGWHWCPDWDGLLVGPDSGKALFCECILKSGEK